MGKLVDLTGETVGRLTIVKRAPNKGVKTMWEYRCSCGNTGIVSASDIAAGRVLSCGCYNKEVVRKHGMSRTRPYGIYHGIMQRCYNPKCKAYQNYGGRGITVCKEWRDSFETFMEWAISNGYSDDLSIDRIDPNGSYCPENCRWATGKQQLNNTRRNVHIFACGMDLTYAQWAEVLGVSRQSVEKGVKNHGTAYIEKKYAERNRLLGI